MINMIWYHMGMCTGCSDCACVSSGPSHAPMQQQSGQVQSAISSTSLSLPANSYGSSASASGYSHAAPSSQGSMIQGPGPGYGSSSSSTTSSSSSSSRSNLNMQSNQGEPGIEEPKNQKSVHFYGKEYFQAYELKTLKRLISTRCVISHLFIWVNVRFGCKMKERECLK